MDLLNIPTSLVNSPVPRKQDTEETKDQPQTSHLRGISFLDELLEVQPEPGAATTPSKGPLAADGTLREEEEEYDDVALEADVNAWLEGGDGLAEGTGWLDQVVLN